MRINVVNRAERGSTDASLNDEGEWVLTWLKGFDGELRK